ncbi:hypothetical protein [Clostridium estertheticum]|uniref:hypothetical protein n=1 Tax=Clostridium estertheticum TaxID=238834 RepID=UPI001C0D7090|nr:hypothetical protein [Clostridium estertheticum]MBU3186636.1 hypothetical protein [Clostridium estertheticum]
MELILGKNYKVVSDERQFILQTLKVTKASKLTLPENVGKETWSDIGYYRKLKEVLKAAGDQVVLDNKELPVIIEKLKELQLEINKISNLFEITESEVKFNEEN